MRKDIQVGDIVKVVAIGPTSSLVLDALVTVREINEFSIVVQAENEDAYICGRYGWTHKEFGPYCHNVHIDEINPVSRYHTLPQLNKMQMKIPVI